MSEKKAKKPSLVYPELIRLLAEVYYHVQELHRLLTLRSIAEAFGIKHQSFSKQVEKVKKGIK